MSVTTGKPLAKRSSVLDAVRVVIEQKVEQPDVAPVVKDYENPHVARQVLRVVLSYTDYINRTVWSK